MARKQRITRAVYVVYITGVALFVVASTFQVARDLFGNSAAAASTPSATVGSACANGLAAEMAAIDTARARAASEENGDLARVRYVSERERVPGAANAACAGDPHASEALAALARFDRASESHALREARDLSPVRHAAQSFIRALR